MHKVGRTIVAIVIACLVVVPLARAQAGSAADTKSSSPSMHNVITALWAGKNFDQTAISPDGKQVAWVESTKAGSAIFISAATGGTPRRITADGQAESAIAWSPDSKQIAFLSDAGNPGQPQLYTVNTGTGSPRNLTSVKGFLASPGWSPDGKTIAFLFTENAERAAGPLVAEKAQTGVIKETVTEQRLALIDSAGGKVRQISPADMYVYEYAWSPDGKSFVTTAAHGNGDDNWYVAQINTIAAAGGDMKSIYTPPIDSQIAVPAWSPDGKMVGFISGIMSDESAVGGDIFIVPATGGAAKIITPGMKASASWLTWRSDGKILFGEDVDGESGIATVDPTSGAIATLTREPGELSAYGWGTAVSLAADGKTASVFRQSLAHPPEIWAGQINQW
jgi:Tol biopolymer transport system component